MKATFNDNQVLDNMIERLSTMITEVKTLEAITDSIVTKSGKFNASMNDWVEDQFAGTMNRIEDTMMLVEQIKATMNVKL